MAGSNFFASPPLRARLAARDWILAGLFFLTGIWLYTRHNDFPSFYHPDEPSKAGQVIKNEFNFNHPMLLLQTTRLISWIRDSPRTQQPVTRDGRTASALFAAGAVACLVLLAAHLRSTLAGAAAGLLVLANSQFFELAHYMKEDPALAFGIAAFFLTLVRCWLEPSTVRFVWLGVACALAGAKEASSSEGELAAAALTGCAAAPTRAKARRATLRALGTAGCGGGAGPGW